MKTRTFIVVPGTVGVAVCIGFLASIVNPEIGQRARSAVNAAVLGWKNAVPEMTVNSQIEDHRREVSIEEEALVREVSRLNAEVEEGAVLVTAALDVIDELTSKLDVAKQRLQITESVAESALELRLTQSAFVITEGDAPPDELHDETEAGQ